jgi:DNA-binding LacI/PurR family transcriptional regulator
MALTMKDVARRAGVSVKSVSRVVNGDPGTSSDIRSRVEGAIEELGWRPNLHARSLRTGRTGMIVLAVHDLQHPATAHLVQELVSEAERDGLRVTIEPHHGVPEKLARTIAGIGPLVDAAVILNPEPQDVLDLAPGYTYPGVVVLTASSRGTDLVLIDASEALASMSRHLHNLGKQRTVALLPPETYGGKLADALRQHSSVAAVLHSSARPDRELGMELAHEALEAVPELDAVACADDLLAIGALGHLYMSGISVPDEVAVTGYGNTEDGQSFTPSLTTLDPQDGTVARTVFDILRRRLSGDDSPSAPIRITPHLLRRESTLGITSYIPFGVAP